MLSHPAGPDSDEPVIRRLPPRPTWLWCVFLAMVGGAVAGGYIAVRENPWMMNIRYLARYPDNVSVSGTAVGYFRWRYDSLVVHEPGSGRLTVTIDSQRYDPRRIDPHLLASLGGQSMAGAESSVWVVTRGRQSLWCDFQGDRLVQMWLRTQEVSAGEGRIGFSWDDAPPAFLPLDSQDLMQHLGPPVEVLKERDLRLFSGL